MELTRRRVLAAAASGGVGTTASLASFGTRSDRDSGAERARLSDPGLRTLAAVAETVYPAAVSDPIPLVEDYLGYQPEHRVAAIRTAAAELNRTARARYGGTFAALSGRERLTLLRELGVDRTGAARDGTLPERIRYYLVDGVLYALFTNPAGGQLVGVTNPRGHPGGYDSYTRSTDANDG